MNQLKLKNIKTGEEHLCDKVTIDGFDYYVSDKFIEDGRENFFTYDTLNCKILHISHIKYFGDRNDGKSFVLNGRSSFVTFEGTYSGISHPEVIACNNPNITIPQVLGEVEMLANQKALPHLRAVYIEAYNKSQESHPFSEEDVCQFVEWTNLHYRDLEHTISFKGVSGTKELLQLWKQQQPKTIYYNG